MVTLRSRDSLKGKKKILHTLKYNTTESGVMTWGGGVGGVMIISVGSQLCMQLCIADKSLPN